MSRVALGLALQLLLPSPAAAQGGDPQTYIIEYSDVPMARTASVFETGLRLIERGSDWLLGEWTGDLFTRRSMTGVLARVGWWTAFGFLVEGCGAAAVHEYGHETRAEEVGLSGRVFVRCTGTSFFRATGAQPPPLKMMGVFGGGMEAEAVLAERIEDRIYARGSATAGDLTLLFLTRGGAESYILSTLSENRLRSAEAFLDGVDGRTGDPSLYAEALAAARLSQPTFGSEDVVQFFPEIQRSGRSIRRGSLINLIDYGNVSIGVGIFRDYLWRGEERIPVRWLRVGPLSFAPGLAYRLSPEGPERLVRSRYKVGTTIGQGYVRWTEKVASGRGVLGGGGDVRRPPIRGIEPRVAVDIWRNPDGTTSLRGEVGGAVSRAPAGRVVFTFAAGAKGRGYLLGQPLEPGAYFRLGAGIRF